MKEKEKIGYKISHAGKKWIASGKKNKMQVFNSYLITKVNHT